VRKRCKAACVRHVQIEEQEVGIRARLERGKQCAHGVTLDEADVTRELRHRLAQRLAEERMVVGDHDLKRHSSVPH